MVSAHNVISIKAAGPSDGTVYVAPAAVASRHRADGLEHTIHLGTVTDVHLLKGIAAHWHYYQCDSRLPAWVSLSVNRAIGLWLTAVAADPIKPAPPVTSIFHKTAGTIIR
jgi:hypothetical protein